MTIQFKSAGTPVDGSAPLSITRPTIAEGDIIKIAVVMDTEDGNAAISGFTEVINLPNPADDLRLQIFTKVAGASEPASYSITSFVGGAKATIELYEDSIGGGTWTVGTPVSNTGSGAVNVGPLSTTNNGMMLGTWANDSDSTVTSAPSGMTLATNAASGGTSVALYCYYEFIATGGSDSRSLTYSGDATSGVLFELTYSGPAGPTIDSVDDPDEFSGTLNYTTTGLGTITTATIEDSATNTISLLSIGDASSVIPDYGNNVNRVLTGTVTLALGDGVEGAGTTFTLDPKTNYSVTTLTSGFSTTSESFLFNYGGTPAIGDQFHALTTAITLNADGSWETPGAGTVTIYGVDATDGVMQSFTHTTGVVSIPSDESLNKLSLTLGLSL